MIELEFMKVGQCQHLECIAARGGRLGKIEFPALCAVIKHPTQGYMLFDTGYSEHFFTATQPFPEALYRWSLPVKLPHTANLLAQLAELGIKAEDITKVLLSHYHGDHIAGIKDFKQARFIASKTDSEAMQKFSSSLFSRFRATLHGFLPALLPDDYWQRLDVVELFPLISLPNWMTPFSHGYDIFADGSCIAVPLPGHSQGQLGLLVTEVLNRGPVFLVADACWSMPACKEGRLPSLLANFVQHNTTQYRQTFLNIQQLSLREPEVTCLPSHCISSFKQYHQITD